MATATKTTKPRAKKTTAKRAATVDVRAAQRALNQHGFPCGKVDGKAGAKTAAAVKRFQTAYAGGRRGGALLKIDGRLGAKTAAALKGLPYLAPNFTTIELACRHCGLCYVHRSLVRGLQELRNDVDKPVRTISGYRCPAHNRAIKGAEDSQHIRGRAADVDYPCRIEQAMRLGVFTGIGDTNGRVRHLDTRTGRDPKSPARWSYR